MPSSDRLFLCLWCKAQKPREEMRGRRGGTGPVPSTCFDCRIANPTLSWCKHHDEPHPLDRFHMQNGRPDLLCMAAAYEVYGKPTTQTCPWCGERKTNAEMKGASGVKGYPPATCASCRAANPDLSWCTWHREPHRLDRFEVKGSRVRPMCRLGRHESRYPDEPPRQCQSCNESRSAGLFSGRGLKRFVCEVCVEAHPGEKWCRLCASWRNLALFPGGGSASGSLCTACHAAERHNTTVPQILAIQGATRPECAVCRSQERLCVDHDHGCCGGERPTSCGKCVRGYLCYRCNTAEGSLRTSERAFALANYLLAHETREAQWHQPAKAPG